MRLKISHVLLAIALVYLLAAAWEWRSEDRRKARNCDRMGGDWVQLRGQGERLCIYR